MQAQQQPNLQVVFQNVDKDRSGRIDALELQRALSNGTWEPFNPETCRLMISLFDPYKSGQIDFNGFQQLWAYVSQWTGIYSSIDRDRSGNLDVSEVKQALSGYGYRLSDQFYQIMFKKYDRTKSGRMLFDDFIQCCIVLQQLTDVFRQKDHQRNGTITVQYEEFLTMIMSMNIPQGNH